MITVIYRRIGELSDNDVAEKVDDFQEELNGYLYVGWELRSSGVTNLHIWAIIEKEVNE